MPDGRLPNAIPVDLNQIHPVAHGPMPQVPLLWTRPPQHLVVIGGHHQRTAQPPDGARRLQTRLPHLLGRRIELRFQKGEPQRPPPPARPFPPAPAAARARPADRTALSERGTTAPPARREPLPPRPGTRCPPIPPEPDWPSWPGPPRATGPTRPAAGRARWETDAAPLHR